MEQNPVTDPNSAVDPFIGEIKIWPMNFAPVNWAFCNGQLLAITSNTALFSLIGTSYGGDGRTTFALPDLRGRIPAGAGTGAGISTRNLGQRGGSETRAINVLNMPPHNHSIQSNQAIGGGIELIVNSEEGEEGDPNGNYLAGTEDTGYSDESGSGTLKGLQNNLALSGPITCGLTGGGQAFSILNPFLSFNFIIALYGIYPSRS